jgi:lipopolysaccharide transport system ATP-binding protein
MSAVIEVNDLGKLYMLGKVGTGTLSHDLKRWWAVTRGLDDPYTKVGSVNDRTKKASGNEYVWALKDLNFKVNQGEIVGVIGKNGAGKSTLLKILSRITAPSTGEVKIKGRIGSLLEVGTGFHPEMTGRENVFMNGTVLGMRRHEIVSKFDDIVDFAGVAKYIDTPVKRYSSGMMVRLGFAVAAFLEPEILIVDEVLAVGDNDFQNRAIGKLESVSSKSGRTVLFVSHNMGSIARVCKTGILMDKGSLKYRGKIQDVIDSYLSVKIKSQYVSDKENGFKLIEVTDETGTSKNEFKYGEEIRFKIRGEIPNVRGVVCSFSLLDKHKKVVFSGYKPINNRTNIDLQLYMPKDTLLPGSYSINFALHIPNVELIDNVSDLLAFTVTETGSDFFLFNGLDYGSVNVPMVWKEA